MAITLQLEQTPSMVLNMNGAQEIELGIGGGGGYVPIRNYEQLINKPQINSVELIGNKLLADLFPDGIIVDGGSAEGVI